MGNIPSSNCAVASSGSVSRKVLSEIPSEFYLIIYTPTSSIYYEISLSLNYIRVHVYSLTQSIKTSQITTSPTGMKTLRGTGLVDAAVNMQLSCDPIPLFSSCNISFGFVVLPFIWQQFNPKFLKSQEYFLYPLKTYRWSKEYCPYSKFDDESCFYFRSQNILNFILQLYLQN